MTFVVRLQNSPYFCVFKYARAVKQKVWKVWNEAENGERDWGETLKIRTVRFAYVIFVRITRFSQPRQFPLAKFRCKLSPSCQVMCSMFVLPLPLIFYPPLSILHFTIYTTFHRDATLKTALELLDYSVTIRSQVQTITRAFLPRNQSPSVSNSQRGRSCEQIFDSSTTFLNPLVGTNSLYGKRIVFFPLVSHALRACETRALRARKTLTPRFTDFFTDFEKKTTVLQSTLL